MKALKIFSPGAAAIGVWANDETPGPPTPAMATLMGADGAATATLDLARERFEHVNPRCRELLALDGEGVAALRLADLAPGLDERAALLGALRQDGRWEGAWTFRRAGTAPVWLQAVVAVWRRDESGAPTHAIAVMLDVSAQGRRLERLLESEERSRQGQAASGLALFSRDLTSDVVAFNASTLALFGLSSGEAELSFSDALSRMAPSDAPRLRAAIEDNLARRGRDLKAEFSFWRASDGQKRDIELRVAYEYDAKGQPLRSVGAAIDVTERGPTQDRLAFAARQDPLTGLCDRPALLEHLAEACAFATPGDPIAVLRLDLDRLSDAGAVHGGAFADLLRVQIGRRLRGQLRGVDRLARLGEESFALLMTGLREPEDAGGLARRLVARLREPFMIEGQRIALSASIGVALAPHDGLGADDLLGAADLALAEAKADACDGLRYFDAGMNAQAVARHRLETDLRRALKNREFELFYQPMLGARDMRIMKFEALIRWRDPVRGLIAPDHFIPACERNGMIGEIGDWVLLQACADAATWPDDIGVAVNVSAVQVARGDLDKSVAAALTASGLKADRLEIEITETALLHNTEATLEALLKVKALGVRIAMDDFGVGYASLGYLQRFPFDKVKIDRSFTREVAVSPQGAARLKAILDLCAAFDLSTTIEGVETQVQLETLTRLGGTKFQGFLFSPPRPADCVAGLIENFGGGAGATKT